MEITRVVRQREAPVTGLRRIRDCTACGAPLFVNSFSITAFADGDYFKTLYVVCSDECEKAINEED